MVDKHNRTRIQSFRWWWHSKALGFFRVRFSGSRGRAQIRSSEAIEFKKQAMPLRPPTEGITVILNAYKRTEYLADQIKALRAQSVPPKEIWVWCNQSDSPLYDISEMVDRVVVSNTNWLFWGRFALGNLVRTEYVAFFDDDILPQPRWFENCLNVLKSHGDAILGGSGVILPLTGGYSTKTKVGWNGYQMSTPTPVDLVGHCWFFPKKHLQYMWREEPQSWDNGEDIHLSYMALKYGNIETVVPPHPEDDMGIWSCRPDFGRRVGKLGAATHKTADHSETRSFIVNAFRQDGWQLACDRYASPTDGWTKS